MFPPYGSLLLHLVPAWKYLGCFVDQKDRILNDYLGSTDTNTPNLCMERCLEKGYSYAGVQVWIMFILNR